MLSSFLAVGFKGFHEPIAEGVVLKSIRTLVTHFSLVEDTNEITLL